MKHDPLAGLDSETQRTVRAFKTRIEAMTPSGRSRIMRKAERAVDQELRAMGAVEVLEGGEGMVGLWQMPPLDKWPENAESESPSEA